MVVTSFVCTPIIAQVRGSVKGFRENIFRQIAQKIEIKKLEAEI